MEFRTDGPIRLLGNLTESKGHQPYWIIDYLVG
ncbi:uncharacterized protein G2W53_020042 [Senna tora]|uniref:Uncharacterized protein n=1 Tax=Senna tora TaxID=362788 RepID=A0A834TVA8_9FABA|nr:uncharacterized protein G2W53_020042 [Senna tora]